MIFKLNIRPGQSVADSATKINDDGSAVNFLFVESNPDYQEYLEWLAEGNTPEPADEGQQ